MGVLRVVYSLLVLGGLGTLFGIALAVLSRVLQVKVDKRVARLDGILPGLNCGACGYAGCSSYAEAIINDGAELTLCTPGGGDTASKLGTELGIEVEESSKRMVAQIFCRGTEATTTFRYDYTAGIEDCNAVHAAFNGDKSCSHGCLGRGSCIKVCPVDAIHRHPSGYIEIDPDGCIGCGKCVQLCPTGVIKWVPSDADLIVACNSTERGAVVKKHCSVGCVGCKICEKRAPDGGFAVKENLATIDYEQSGERIYAMEGCPTKCIVKITSITKGFRRRGTRKKRDR